MDSSRMKSRTVKFDSLPNSPVSQDDCSPNVKLKTPEKVRSHLLRLQYYPWLACQLCFFALDTWLTFLLHCQLRWLDSDSLATGRPDFPVSVLATPKRKVLQVRECVSKSDEHRIVARFIVHLCIMC